MNYITHPLNDFGWWAMNQCLNLTSAAMQSVNPLVPEWILHLASQGLLKLSDLVNRC